MMSERDDAERSLLDSKQKVALTPAAAEPSSSEAAVTSTPQPRAALPQTAPAAPVVEEKSEAPAPEAVAAVALADTVETPAIAATSVDMPAQTPLATPQQTPTAQEPAEGAPKPVNMPETKESTGIIFEELPIADEPTQTQAGKVQQTPTEPAEPLPVLPPEEMPKAQVFVAHHSSSTGGLKVFLILLAVAALAVIAFDVMLDAGFVTLDAVPHTNFF